VDPSGNPLASRTLPFARLRLALLALTLLHCGSSSSEDGTCYPDADGITALPSTISLTVTDDEFSRAVINTQNNSSVTLTLTNAGSVPHGFAVGCMDVTAEYPHLPAGCSSKSCFPAESTFEPIMPGESKTVTFITPVPDNIIYPFQSSAPDDAMVPGLNGGQWSVM
jgi:hypothetical protein